MKTGRSVQPFTFYRRKRPVEPWKQVTRVKYLYELLLPTSSFLLFYTFSYHPTILLLLFFLFIFFFSIVSFFYSLNGLTRHDWRKLYNGRDVGICRVIYYKKWLHVKTEERRECMFFARIFLLTGFRAQPAIFPKLQKVAAPRGPILTTHSDTSGTVVRPTFHLAFRPSSCDFLLAIRRAGNRYGSCERSGQSFATTNDRIMFVEPIISLRSFLFFSLAKSVILEWKCIDYDNKKNWFSLDSRWIAPQNFQSRSSCWRTKINSCFLIIRSCNYIGLIMWINDSFRYFIVSEMHRNGNNLFVNV